MYLVGQKESIDFPHKTFVDSLFSFGWGKRTPIYRITKNGQTNQKGETSMELSATPHSTLLHFSDTSGVSFAKYVIPSARKPRQVPGKLRCQSLWWKPRAGPGPRRRRVCSLSVKLWALLQHKQQHGRMSTTSLSCLKQAIASSEEVGLGKVGALGMGNWKWKCQGCGKRFIAKLNCSLEGVKREGEAEHQSERIMRA